MTWIDVKDRLPNHHQIVLGCSPKGMAVLTFVDSVKMNETLSKGPYSHEQVDVKLHPYYFVSQEIRQHTANDITHWMALPSRPA